TRRSSDLPDVGVVPVRGRDDEVVRLGEASGLFYLLLAVVAAQRGVGADRVVGEERLLEDQGDALGYLLPVQVGQAPPVEADVSPLRVVEADEQMGDRRLAGSGRADQGH